MPKEPVTISDKEPQEDKESLVVEEVAVEVAPVSSGGREPMKAPTVSESAAQEAPKTGVGGRYVCLGGDKLEKHPANDKPPVEG